MDRRKYLKTLAAGTLTTGVLLNACSPEEKKEALADLSNTGGPDRQPALDPREYFRIWNDGKHLVVRNGPQTAPAS